MTASSGKPSSASSPPLQPGEIHLWLCDREVAAGLDATVLDAGEKARAARWRGEGPADFALGRVLLRHTLSRYGPLAPGDWAFETAEHGKPGLAAGQAGMVAAALEFNLSHSGHWLALAVSGGAAVGVDVQVIEPRDSLRRLARRYFSAAEVAQLEQLEGDAFPRHFHRLWTLKEAWTKTRGEPLPGALGSTSFSLEGGELLSLAPAQTRNDSLWLLEMDGYALAVCGLARGLALRCWERSTAGEAMPFEPRLVAASGGA